MLFLGGPVCSVVRHGLVCGLVLVPREPRTNMQTNGLLLLTCRLNKALSMLQRRKVEIVGVQRLVEPVLIPLTSIFTLSAPTGLV